MGPVSTPYCPIPTISAKVLASQESIQLATICNYARGGGHNGWYSDMLTFNVGTGFGGEQPLLCMFGAFDDAVPYGLSQSGETGDVAGHPYGEVLVVLRIALRASQRRLSRD